MAFYIWDQILQTTEISTHPNSTQQESNYIYLHNEVRDFDKNSTQPEIRSTEFEQ